MNATGSAHLSPTDSFSRVASSIQSKFPDVELALLLLHYVIRMQLIFRANFNILWAGQHEIRMQPGAWLVNSSTATELESRCEFAWATTAPGTYGLGRRQLLAKLYIGCVCFLYWPA